jgi:Rhodopirellula transposase DDE domain
LRIDGKATGHMGELSRGGVTWGEPTACDHDCGCREQDIPWGLVEEASGECHLTCGSASKTSDGIVETLEATWPAMDAQAQGAGEL